MEKAVLNIAEQLARLASRFQEQRTGHAPRAVTVVLGEDTLVVTLHDALTPAEKALAKSPQGAAQVQEFHRQLFANSTAEMRQAIKRITGRDVREAAAEIETETGSVILAFGTGAMVQVFLLSPRVLADAVADNNALERADDEGLRVTPTADDPNDSVAGRGA
jgi:uncharacterized protein YbcI